MAEKTSDPAHEGEPTRTPLHHERAPEVAKAPAKFVNTLARQVVDALNAERARKGLPPFPK